MAPCVTGAPALEGSVLAKIRQALLAANLIRDTKVNPDEPACECGSPEKEIPSRGVSLAWLKSFSECLRLAGLPKDYTTANVVTKVLQSLVRSALKKNCAWEVIPAEHLGPPEHYLIHAWQGSFQDMVNQLVIKFDPPPPPNHPPQPPATLKGFFLWVDFVSVPFNEFLGHHIDTAMIKQAVTTCQKGALLIIDKGLAFLNRTWCLFEIFLTVYNLEVSKLHILFPLDLDIQLPRQLESQLRAVDLSLNSECTKPEDKLRIIADVKHSVGLKRMHESLKGGMEKAARATLRWGNMMQLSAYCALLLEGHEFSLLNCTLSSLPELAVDEKMLNEIKEIFMVYDSDGSGELDKVEFVAVLGVAGFSEAEANDIFDQVNTDGGDGVGIEEFESWWAESQKTLWQGQRRQTVDTTVEGLMKLLDGYHLLLTRTGGMEELSPYFQTWRDRLRSGSLLDLQGKLSPPTMRGDWRSTVDQLAWKLHNEDHKGAIKLMHTFLLENADALDSSIGSIVSPKAEASRKEILIQLHAYLDLLVLLLRWHPSKAGQAKHFGRAADQYKSLISTADDPLLGSPRGKGKLKSNFAKNGQKGKKGQKSWLTFDLISSMVHLKYGEDQTISQGLIQEAGSALGRWMAANRSKGGKPGRDVGDMSRDYLYNMSSTDPDEIGSGRSPGARRAGAGGHSSKDTDGKLPPVRGSYPGSDKNGDTIREQASRRNNLMVGGVSMTRLPNVGRVR